MALLTFPLIAELSDGSDKIFFSLGFLALMLSSLPHSAMREC
jgi:hypothetical protein